LAGLSIIALAVGFAGNAAGASVQYNDTTVGASRDWSDSVWSETWTPGTTGHEYDSVTLNTVGTSGSTLTIDSDLTLDFVYASHTSSRTGTIILPSAYTLNVAGNGDGTASLTLDSGHTTGSHNWVFENYGTLNIDNSGYVGQGADLTIRDRVNGAGGRIDFNIRSGGSVTVTDTDAGEVSSIRVGSNNYGGDYFLNLYGDASASADEFNVREGGRIRFDDTGGELGSITIAGNFESEANATQPWNSPQLYLDLGNIDTAGTYELITIGGGWTDLGGNSIDPTEENKLFRGLTINGNASEHGTFANSLGKEFDVNGITYQLDVDTDSLDLTVIPEPATLGLFALAAGIALLKRRKM
jgi:hypothetical protein